MEMIRSGDRPEFEKNFKKCQTGKRKKKKVGNQERVMNGNWYQTCTKKVRGYLRNEQS